MGLKKYTEYIGENKNMKSSTPEERIPKVQEPKEPKENEKISVKKPSQQNQLFLQVK